MSTSPRVWSKFSATNRNSGATFNFRIVDLPKERYGDFLEQYMNYFAKEESTFKASGVSQSAEALEEIREVILKRRDDGLTHTVICCLDNENDDIKDIIGSSIMMLGTAEDVLQQKLHPKTDAVKKRYVLLDALISAYDDIKELNLEKHFTDRGIFVHPDYRGFGIAQELLRVRRLICKENGVPIHGSWMTSYGTQIAAERDGWETVFELKMADLEKKYDVSFGNGPPTSKYMVARIPLS